MPDDEKMVELMRQLADLKRQNDELREAIVALMEPGTPRVLLGRTGVIVVDKTWPERLATS
jgi:hypothetical protein